MAKKKSGFSHKLIEQNVGLLIILSIAVISFAGLVQIVPLFFQHSTTTPTPGVMPYEPLNLVGRDVYIREGCVGCHSQQIRMLSSEVQRYGPYSLAGESTYDYPFLWGSKRTGPDLARVGGRYSDDWHRVHLRNPRDVVPESNMPAYGWLARNSVENENVQTRMRVLRRLGVPYTDEQIEQAPEQLKGKTEEDALIAYLQDLGVAGRAAAAKAVAEGAL
ncbi:cytochrome-c oxidase, cbb3-type subunit II [Pollutimonas thiosulfatoxidans]|uniref:Cytochrome-c oxidase, cbb3-type subunit II n=1 Tax=Pollutimonas thiosulfatoxidans TaxID=2028345 RepID=A0A410GBE4_9BURK|nr:cytochrome-c oxidase, cbb3-type subunit II [Pollutimonas thiosulfatoxidans]MBF6617398.1 cytochrome-c oxidase, cbb3-type subunit II [Candidimonas sp.]NYT46195.1 cytochrome-c oxidase, cbb3-type subunit II [Alcaligenaceae bacterium]QAA93616.1 cytochrome-c oxidase, cbb3-type subunit II [Pollutimonas thiosulfatoxidans]